HPAPQRKYTSNLEAGVQITASDGEARRIGAGEVILVEDTWGKGHLSKALDGALRHCIFVTLDLMDAAAPGERHRTRITRLDGRVVNVARFRGQLFVCATGCCCGRTDGGFPSVSTQLYHDEWERRRLRDV